MDTLRTPAAVAAVLCALLATVAAGCGGGSSAHSAPSAGPTAVTSSRPPGCVPQRPILYLGGAARANGVAVKSDVTSGAGNTWSPDGAEQAYVSANASRLILRTATGAEHALFIVPAHFAIVHRPAWSADGSRLALILLDERGMAGGMTLGSYQPHLIVIDAQTGKPTADVLLSPKVVNMPYITNPPDTVAFSPDGGRVAVSWDSLAVVDVARRSVVQVWPAPAVAAWSPGGRLLFIDVAGRSRFGALRSWSPAGTRVVWTSSQLRSRGIAVQRGVEYGQLRVSPDGTRLAIRTAAGAGTAIDVFRMTPDGPGVKVKGYPVGATIWDADWSPDSRCLAAVVLDGPALTVRTLNLSSGVWKTLATLDATVDSPDTLDALGPVKKLSWSS